MCVDLIKNKTYILHSVQVHGEFNDIVVVWYCFSVHWLPEVKRLQEIYFNIIYRQKSNSKLL